MFADKENINADVEYKPRDCKFRITRRFEWTRK